MGGGWYPTTRTIKTRHIDHSFKQVTKKDTYGTLIDHINMELPEVPKDTSPENMIKFTLEAVTTLLSPEKLSDEDNNFACENIVAAIRKEFKRDLIRYFKRNFRKED